MTHTRSKVTLAHTQLSAEHLACLTIFFEIHRRGENDPATFYRLSGPPVSAEALGTEQV